tara:strand:- start:13126 stop:14226 length:1101 start_codon:yes stop_codon:yes gene_type:complete
MVRNALITFFVLFSNALFAQGFLKYSTVYTSAYGASPMEAQTEYYVTQGGDLQDITIENPFDYRYTLGIRRVARYDYENRQNPFYDGHNQSTTSLSATVGAVNGFEYLAQYDRGRQQGRDYINQRYFLRYLAKRWIIKGEYFDQGLVDLNYAQVESRLRLHIGEVDFSVGVAARSHRPYGYNPIADYLADNPWWDLVRDMGYVDVYYGIDYDNDDLLDNFDWYWLDPDGNKVADTDEDFRKYIYGDIVNEYNKSQLSQIGTLASLSAILGVDYYHYSDKFWLHSWASMLPWHMHIYGDPMFSYEQFADELENTNHWIPGQWIDYSFGTVLGYKIGLNWGIFAEGEYMKYWDREVFNVSAGINYQFR